MVDLESSRFAVAAIRSGLLTAEDLQAYWRAIPPEKRTHEKLDRYLARHAVGSGKITIWQAQQLAQGRWNGVRVGKYLVSDLIGQGGMGRVYLARDTQAGRQVALKVLSRQRTTNPRALARFAREARLGMRLRHENLVGIYETGEFRGVHYLVMEYVQGVTIARLLGEQGRIKPAIAAELGRQAALGLDQFHLNGLLHRDVTPANILIDRQGTAKLADLGLALDLEDIEVLTNEGATVGTLDYISPEQARHPRSIDIRSDIYSLGTILYHMIAGELPFPMLSLSQRVLAHQFSTPPALTTKVADCPPELDAVVQRMLRKLPAERYKRPADVAAALAPFASGRVTLEQLQARDEPGAEAPGPAEPFNRDGPEPATHVAVWFDSNQEQAEPPDLARPLISDSEPPDVFVKEDVAPAAAESLLTSPPFWAGVVLFAALVALAIVVITG